MRLSWFLQVSMLVASSGAGQIQPKTAHPIQLSYTNAQVSSECTFMFQIETGTIASSVMKIIFPSASYVQGLGTAGTCEAFLVKGQTLSCQVTDRTVSIAIGELSNSPTDNTYTISLSPVLNPAFPGLTGHFRISTWTGVNLLDFTDFFGQVGITAAYVSIASTTMSCERSCKAGDNDLYQFSFLLSLDINPDARVSLTPSVMMIWDSSLGCSSTQIPFLTCTQLSNGSIQLSSFQDRLKSNTLLQIAFPNVQNPTSSGTFVTYGITILDPLINHVIAMKAGIPGPKILPNAILVTSVCPNAVSPCSAYEPYVSMLNRMIVTVAARTTNAIPANGAIQISFSANFGPLETGTCVVLSGLTGNQITCIVNSSTGTATIVNISAFSGGTFSFQIRLTTPNTPGAVQGISISSYLDATLGTAIDATDTAACLNVANMYVPNKWTWTPTAVIPGLTAALSITFQPHASLLSPGTSHIKIRLPSSAPVSLSGNPQVNICAFGIQPLSGSSWDPVSGLLDVPLAAGPGTVPNNCDNSLTISSITLPPYPGTYPFEIIINNGSQDFESQNYWVSVSPLVFSVGSANNDAWDVGVMTIYEISFKPDFDVPASSGNAISGSITIAFPVQDSTNDLLWPADLGTGVTTGGKVECIGVSNIVPVVGNAITCVLVTGSSPLSSAVVTVSNFQKLTSGVPVQLNLANISNILTQGLTPIVTVSTSTVLQGVATILNTGSFPLPGPSYDNSVSPPLINGRSPAPFGDGQNVVEFLPNSLRRNTIMRFSLWLENPVPAVVSSTLYIKFPLTYPLPWTGVVCRVTYWTNVPCYALPDIGWIVVLGIGTGFSAHVAYPFDITGITNPINRIPSASLSIVSIVSNIISEYIYFAQFPLFDLGIISPATVSADDYDASHIDTTYFFVFTASSPLLQNSKIVLTFPKNSYVLTTNPALKCLCSGLTPGFTTPVTCTFQKNTVELTGFTGYPGNMPVIVKILHVLNPVAVGLTDFFSVETFSDVGYLIDANYGVVGIEITAKPPLGTVTHTGTWTDPSNGLSETTVTVSFIPSVSYPLGTIIGIYFPEAEFPVLPTPPICAISGGLKTMESCSTVGTVLSLVTDAGYVYDGTEIPINITLSGLVNFTPGVTSGPFFVQAVYAGIIINESPSDESYRKATSDMEVTTMSLTDYRYSPTTAGEEAVYNFTLNPVSDFPSNCTFSIQFGPNYPRRLGTSIKCFSSVLSKALDGSLPCSVSSKTVTLYPSQGYKKSVFDTIKLSIFGVINPDAGLTLGYFIGYSKCGYAMLDYVELDVLDVATALPQVIGLENTTLSTHQTGALSTLTLTAQAVPGLNPLPGDQLFLSFPLEYQLEFVQGLITCETEVKGSFWTVPCTAENDRISIYPFNFSYGTLTNYTLVISNIENPWISKEVPYITLAVFIAATRSVLAKTVQNLAVINSLSFEPIGQEVRINGNQPWSQRIGTRSDFVSVHLQSNAPQPFTLTPIQQIPGVSFYPEAVQFELADTSSGFQINADQEAVAGVYYIAWQVKGYWGRQIYAPVRRFVLELTTQGMETINVSDISLIPQGGVSLPIIVSLSHGPATNLTLELIKVGSQPTKVTFLPSQLNFTSGETSKTFLISIDSQSSGDFGEFFIYNSGADSASFSLNETIFSYYVGALPYQNYNVSGLRVMNVTRTTASAKFETSIEMTVTWMLALYGTRIPTIEELRNQTFGDGVVQTPVFGVTNLWGVGLDGVEYRVGLDRMSAGTKYSLFVAGTSIATPVQVVSFTTSPQYRTSYATFKFLQNALGDGEQQLFMSYLANVLLVNISRINIQETNKRLPSTLEATDSSDSPLKTTTGKSLLGVCLYNVLLFSEPGDTNLLTPFQYLSALNNDLITLKSLFPALDGSLGVSPVEISAPVPSFQLDPQIDTVTQTSAEITNLYLTAPGFFSLCLIKASGNVSPPSSHQVYTGTDSSNLPCEQNFTVLWDGNLGTVVFSGLNSDQIYWVYLTAGNDLPRYPDLLSDDNVAGVGFKTGKKSVEVGNEAETRVLGLLLYMVLGWI